MMLKGAISAGLVAFAYGRTYINKPIVPSPSKVERMDDVNACFDTDKLKVFHPNHPSLDERTLGTSKLWFNADKPHKVWVICGGKDKPTNKSRQYICMHHVVKDFYYFKDNSPDKINLEECPPCMFPAEMSFSCPDHFVSMTSDDGMHTWCEHDGSMPTECGEYAHWMDGECMCDDHDLGIMDDHGDCSCPEGMTYKMGHEGGHGYHGCKPTEGCGNWAHEDDDGHCECDEGYTWPYYMKMGHEDEAMMGVDCIWDYDCSMYAMWDGSACACKDDTATMDDDGDCHCPEGYHYKGGHEGGHDDDHHDDMKPEYGCMPDDMDECGAWAHVGDDGECVCDEGYMWEDDHHHDDDHKGGHEMDKMDCVWDYGCGDYSHWMGDECVCKDAMAGMNADGDCECPEGYSYKMGHEGDKPEYGCKPDDMGECGAWAHIGDDGECVCDEGYMWEDDHHHDDDHKGGHEMDTMDCVWDYGCGDYSHWMGGECVCKDAMAGMNADGDCECPEGYSYKMGHEGDKPEYGCKPDGMGECGAWAHMGDDGECVCDEGYVWEDEHHDDDHKGGHEMDKMDCVWDMSWMDVEETEGLVCTGMWAIVSDDGTECVCKPGYINMDDEGDCEIDFAYWG